jgi:hypothetical protein
MLDGSFAAFDSATEVAEVSKAFSMVEKRDCITSVT